MACPSLACFERAVELTSTNCAFCRKRIVSFARRQSKKIDEIFWTEIQSMTEGMDISTLTFESDDVDGRSRPAVRRISTTGSFIDLSVELGSPWRTPYIL
ncbi:hypothetical protein DYB26_015084 [Aphanomyces astaci]|uniref:Uncharacterized protein n=1 Tax=Aphanomyces astaci TaxID=112090 RepID=A0A397EP04_APHAT|nr:hypothetical protein DYB34_004062 [Aphanomyces astaci]RHZ00072.1 hypothetical protein DYB31_015102 [Aphanomyces astaci]RHZ41293.1 hypothetical protein DYB26_015084 [Aphanomyces astaci]